MKKEAKAKKGQKKTHTIIAIAVIVMALSILVMGGIIISRLFNKEANFGLIMSVITFGSFITWAGAMYDRVSSYDILDSFEENGLSIMNYTVKQRMLATSAVIASTFYTIIFMLVAFITVISNADVLSSVL